MQLISTKRTPTCRYIFFQLLIPTRTSGLKNNNNETMSFATMKAKTTTQLADTKLWHVSKYNTDCVCTEIVKFF